MGLNISPSVIAKFITEMFDNSAVLRSEKKDHPKEYTLFVNSEMTDLQKA